MSKLTSRRGGCVGGKKKVCVAESRKGVCGGGKKKKIKCVPQTK